MNKGSNLNGRHRVTDVGVTEKRKLGSVMCGAVFGGGQVNRLTHHRADLMLPPHDFRG